MVVKTGGEDHLRQVLELVQQFEGITAIEVDVQQQIGLEG